MLVLFYIGKDGGPQFTHGIDGFELDVESVESKVEDFKSGDFEKEVEWVFEDTVEGSSEFVGACDLLVDQELC